MRIGRIIAWVVVMALCALAFVMSGATVALAAVLAALILPVAGGIANALAARRLEVSLSTPTSAGKGRAIPLALEVANGSRLPMPCVVARVRMRNLLTGEEGRTEIRLAAAPRKTASVALDLSSGLCGRVECRVEGLVSYEAFRLFSRRRDATAERRLTVMPDLHDAFIRDIYAASPLSDTTVYSQFVKGSDLSETFGLRSYEPGDELKRIHWKLSERLDGLIVREPSLPLDNSLLVFWDKGVRAAGPAADAGVAADALAEVMLAICQRLAHEGVSFEIAANETLEGRCLRSFITDENDIYEMVGHLLSSPLAPMGGAGIDDYTRLFGGLACSRVIYLCADIPAGISSACAGRDLLVVAADAAGPGGAGHPAGVESLPTHTEIHFPAGNAREALTLLGLM